MRAATAMRHDMDRLVLLAASLALAILLVESAGLDPALRTALAWIAFTPMVAVALGTIARNRNMRCLHMAVCAAVLGGIGMLAGAWLDFGRFGLAALADWCSALPPLRLDTVASRFAPAPWTFIGMLAGCNLGMVVSSVTLGRIAAPGSARMARVALCNAGMVAGMVLVEAVLPASLSGFTGIPAPLRVLIAMVLGMTAGMLGGWWIAERALRRRDRPAGLVALRRNPELRS